ncbi:MAG TPA: hypothetical protein VEA92_02490 [Candidatus Paceibacterota bacterium]|nr:hypothetical protein [Candidatus Paceibacterota bacterium]
MADHGHKDKPGNKKRSPHLAVPVVIGIALLFAVGLIVIAVMSRSGTHEGEGGGTTTPATADERPVQDAPRIVHQATATEYLPVPKNSTGEWAEVRYRPHWTNCTGSKNGIETQYRAQPGGDWLPARPNGFVYGWRYRSVDETERILDRNWDTNANCSTPVPS